MQTKASVCELMRGEKLRWSEGAEYFFIMIGRVNKVVYSNVIDGGGWKLFKTSCWGGGLETLRMFILFILDRVPTPPLPACFSRKESLPPHLLASLWKSLYPPSPPLHLITEKMNLQIRRWVCKLEGEFANQKVSLQTRWWVRKLFFVRCILFADIKLCIALHFICRYKGVHCILFCALHSMLLCALYSICILFLYKRHIRYITWSYAKIKMFKKGTSEIIP